MFFTEREERERESERHTRTQTHTHVHTETDIDTDTHLSVPVYKRVYACLALSLSLGSLSLSLYKKDIWSFSMGFGLYTDKFPTPSLVECEHWNSTHVTHTHHVQCVAVYCSVLFQATPISTPKFP